MVKEWYNNAGLKVNATKTKLVLFTGKRNLEVLTTSVLYQQQLQTTQDINPGCQTLVEQALVTY